MTKEEILAYLQQGNIVYLYKGIAYTHPEKQELNLWTLRSLEIEGAIKPVAIRDIWGILGEYKGDYTIVWKVIN